MSIPFDRLRQVLIPQPRPSERLDVPAALGASDTELARLGLHRHGAECAHQQGLALVYGGRNHC